jgi:hypothetical protein
VRVQAALPGAVRPRRVVTATAAAVLRLAGAGLLVTNAAIHGYLWHAGYRYLPTIGRLFLVDAVGASVLALAVLVTPYRRLALFAALGALLELGTVAGLIVSTRHGLFGFVESTRATLYWQSVVTEIAGAAVLGSLALLAYRQTRGNAMPPWW